MHISVEINNIQNNPRCPHGPTVLYLRSNDNRKFYACSASRQRKGCNFFAYEDELNKLSDNTKKIWEEAARKYININHIKLYLTFNEIKGLSERQRMYCMTCNAFQLPKFKEKHKDHDFEDYISDYDLLRPSEFLKPLDDSKNEAQFLFSKTAVHTIVNILCQRNVRNVICVGTPRIHEYILNEKPEMNSILLDIDKRYHNFYGPLQFCWFNIFNNHFFLPEAKNVFTDFLQTDGGDNFVLITDPPFGGRIELLSETFKQICSVYRTLNKRSNELEIMWIFPYFMEPQVLKSLPGFKMLDYKVDYDNHPLFGSGNKARKYGSAVRIFTNIDPRTIALPADQGYKYCSKCERCVAIENKHCKKCNTCPSKDGRTYVHCNICRKCVKPMWQHCRKCNRCVPVDHMCGDSERQCSHCKEKGHIKKNCAKIDNEALMEERESRITARNQKRMKKKDIPIYCYYCKEKGHLKKNCPKEDHYNLKRKRERFIHVRNRKKRKI